MSLLEGTISGFTYKGVDFGIDVIDDYFMCIDNGFIIKVFAETLEEVEVKAKKQWDKWLKDPRCKQMMK